MLSVTTATDPVISRQHPRRAAQRRPCMCQMREEDYLTTARCADHYHTGCFSLHHLILVSESKLQRCSYLRRPKRLVATKMRAQPTIRKRPIVARPTLLLMR